MTQSFLIKPNTTFYKFPDQLEKMCYDAELDWPLETVNEGKNKKPILTEKQIQRIKNFYADDVKLYDSILI